MCVQGSLCAGTVRVLIVLQIQIFRGKWFVRGTYTIIFFSISYSMAILMEAVVLCRPIAYTWDKYLGQDHWRHMRERHPGARSCRHYQPGHGSGNNHIADDTVVATADASFKESSAHSHLRGQHHVRLLQAGRPLASASSARSVSSIGHPGTPATSQGSYGGWPAGPFSNPPSATSTAASPSSAQSPADSSTPSYGCGAQSPAR